jgi:hypothetical protein
LISINVEKIEVCNFKSTLNFFSHHINECKHLMSKITYWILLVSY